MFCSSFNTKSEFKRPKLHYFFNLLNDKVKCTENLSRHSILGTTMIHNLVLGFFRMAVVLSWDFFVLFFSPHQMSRSTSAFIGLLVQ